MSKDYIYPLSWEQRGSKEDHLLLKFIESDVSRAMKNRDNAAVGHYQIEYNGGVSVMVKLDIKPFKSLFGGVPMPIRCFTFTEFKGPLHNCLKEFGAFVNNLINFIDCDLIRTEGLSTWDQKNYLEGNGWARGLEFGVDSLVKQTNFFGYLSNYVNPMSYPTAPALDERLSLFLYLEMCSGKTLNVNEERKEATIQAPHEESIAFPFELYVRLKGLGWFYQHPENIAEILFEDVRYAVYNLKANINSTQPIL